MSNNQYSDFINILRFALTGAEFKAANVNWGEIYILAKRHKVNNLVFEAICNLPESKRPCGEICKKFERDYKRLLTRDCNQEFEGKKVFDKLESIGTEIIVLKGWFLRNLYPKTELRTMADIDFLVKPDNESAVHNVLIEYGYECVSKAPSDNGYKKPPYMVLEMHKCLSQTQHNEIFENVWNNTVLLDGYKHIMRMNNELFYTYMIYHIARHMGQSGGIGIRFFIDLWIYKKHMSDTMNSEIINRQISDLGLNKFKECAETLCEIWFDEKEISDAFYNDFAQYIINCGAYGTMENKVAVSSIKSDGRYKNLMKRIFMPYSELVLLYPQLKSKKYLVPLYSIKRIFGIISDPDRHKHVIHEFSKIKDIESRKIDSVKELLAKLELI